MGGRILLVDCTLRDGEQAPGVAFTAPEKVRVAHLLNAVGVAQIEAGMPAMGPIEQETIRQLAAGGLRSSISTWNRLRHDDIEASLACGVSLVHLG